MNDVKASMHEGWCACNDYVCGDVTCAAASEMDCPFPGVAPSPAGPGPAGPPGPPGPPCECCAQEAVSTIWVVMMSTLCSVLPSVMVTTLLFYQSLPPSGVPMLGPSASEVGL